MFLSYPFVAFADFHTVALIAAYFAVRRKQGSAWKSWKIVILMLLLTWAYSLGLASIPLWGWCGNLGYDPLHGTCKIISCQNCFGEGSFVSMGGIIVTVSVGVPAVVVLVSYSLVYSSLIKAPLNQETVGLRRSVLILTVCYFIFILPILIIEWIPEKMPNLDVIRIGIYSWYWCIYVVNFLIYIIVWRKIRMGIHIFIKDILGDGQKDTHPHNVSVDQSSVWWKAMQKLGDTA